MHLYRQSIIIFGIVVPALAALLVIGAVMFVKGNMMASFENKLTHSKGHEQSRRSALEMEAEISRQRAHVQRWDSELSQETKSTVSTTMKAIEKNLPAKEITQTSFDPMATSGGFGSVSAQKSSQLRMSYRGTYRTMQRAFLELETRMPQLQLQELKIDPSQNQSAMLNFQMTYTAWEN